jgi:hypothetical protein
MIAHLKLMIAKLRREQYGGSAERGRKVLDQLELRLEELEADATEAEAGAEAKPPAEGTLVQSFSRRRPVRAPLRVGLPANGLDDLRGASAARAPASSPPVRRSQD